MSECVDSYYKSQEEADRQRREFWKDVYIAAIASGCSSAEAYTKANDAHCTISSDFPLPCEYD